jgi:hypothetical protein
MGVWFLAISLGNLIAGALAGEFDADQPVAALPAASTWASSWFGTHRRRSCCCC